jgi:hypothetical protein
MMNKVASVLTLFVFISVLSFSQSYRSESDIRKEPKQIVDYYLILPGNPTPFYEPETEMTEFEFRKKYLRPMPNKNIVIDNKNAYMEVQDNSNELSYRLQLTWFKKADGKRIVAVQEYQEGGDCDTRTLAFYTYENQRFTDVTTSVFPKLKLSDFCTSTNAKFSVFDPVYELPQLGTIVKVKAEAICEQDERMRNFNADQYYTYFKNMKCKDADVAWDKVTGKFVIKNSKP